METAFDRGDLPEGTIRAAYDYWQSLATCCRRQSRQCLDPADIPALLPHICLVDIERDPLRFKVRLMGSTLADSLGIDPTGRYVDEIVGTEGLQARFAETAETGAAYWHESNLTFGPKDYKRYTVICMPLFDDGTVNMLFLAARIYFEPT